MFRYVEREPGARDESRAKIATVKRTASRRDFLKLAGAGVVAATLFGARPGAALAQESRRGGSQGGNADTGAESSALLEEFREAASEYGVPAGLLVAMGYTNTRLKMPPPQTNVYEEGDLHGWGSYGIMALVKNPFSDTLGDAAELTGIPEEELKTDRRSNILGGAALLSESLGRENPDTLAGYRGALAGRGGRGEDYEAVTGVGAGELYTDQVFGALRRGFSEKSDSGEKVSLAAQALDGSLGSKRMEEVGLENLAISGGGSR